MVRWKTLPVLALSMGLMAPFEVCAQSPAGMTRNIVGRVDLPAAQSPQEVVQGTAELDVGGQSGAHVHPGIEAGYILSGALEMTIRGQPPRRLAAGETFIIPRGVPHNVRNLGQVPAKVTSVWIVDKGVPLATPSSLAP
ncbi:MAG: hypothetical protein JWO72_3161 [Caulobacteraceae bacterium]|jgi:quercetin dioxygenase-like cupin family protein|nr:hypothetical protein [Caulobacteraceae bacterium]